MPESFTNKTIKYVFNSKTTKATCFIIQVGHQLTNDSKMDLAMYYLEVNKFATVTDSSSLNKIFIYTPEMIMDSLTKYRFYYERKNRGRFYVILKGQGPIWYLHKAMLTYLWSDPGSFNIRKKKGSEMLVTRHYPANAGEALNAKDPPEPYRALMFMGLQTSKFYKDKVDDAREVSFQPFIQALTYKTKDCP